MNAWLIGFIGIIYAIVAAKFFVQGQVGMGITYIGYAIGNVGLVMLALQL